MCFKSVLLWMFACFTEVPDVSSRPWSRYLAVVFTTQSDIHNLFLSTKVYHLIVNREHFSCLGIQKCIYVHKYATATVPECQGLETKLLEAHQ